MMENNEWESAETQSDALISATGLAASQLESTVTHPEVLSSATGLAPAPEILGQEEIDGPALVEDTASETPTTIEELEPEQQKQERKKHPSPTREALQHFRRDTRAMISLGFLIFLVLLALFGPPIYQHIGGIYNSDLQGKIGPATYHSYDHQELSKVNQGPSAQYWLGTDALGQDMLARLMQGLLISLTVAFLVEVVDVSLGVTVGVLAGYYGGWIDALLARFTDLVFAFPGLLFAILLTGVFGPTANDYFSKLPLVGGFLSNGNASLVIVSLALSLVSWPLMARYVRGLTLQIKHQQFIEAARTSGTNDVRIMLKHIIPNLFNIVIVTSTMNIAGTIIGEAGLSLLGLGVTHPGSSLGLMIADGISLLEVFPWDTLFPTIILTGIVLAISFLGDGLRDAFDPRAKG
ncbi:ABC transporter permease [Dictyobacter kobayashii]|uniref:Peptide ABC transporter substrate-binding protein n=1 Tax=Dictyobacter kobayashii TaxID=2014872 RepID=A0A402AIV4_9CHLR|nr:ABC transporter permease [Dictyobacter kobayashii]GCE19047.1 peptide ABC transporter substrate-binding protein [Dictyobacter kobayashii]